MPNWNEFIDHFGPVEWTLTLLVLGFVAGVRELDRFRKRRKS